MKFLFINLKNVLNTIFDLLSLYFILKRKRYKYSKTRIKRKFNFLINVIFKLV